MRCAFDIGGTFTDFLLLDGDSAHARIHKRLTTPADPAQGSLVGLNELLEAAGVGYDELETVVHGSTLVTNLVIERKGAPTALLTTRGFRDVLELGTEQRYDVHDIFLRFPAPLVPRAWRFEVDERISRDGAVLTAVDLKQVHEIAGRAVAEGVKAIAVVFLHSYRNDAHEREVAAYLREHFPDISVSISSEVCGEIREYERCSTTVANAYAQPLVAPYIAQIEQYLHQRGFRGSFYLVQSSGTLASPEMARRLPIRLLESGPAGGGLAAAYFGRVTGRDDLISFDMGGTTAKVCLIQNGKPDIAAMIEAAREHRFKRGSGLPIRAPVIDMIEIGAGGGSIASIDQIGLLKVGPQSSGADPGPVCYGNGGTAPTVTDANLLLGYLGADSFLGGRLALDTAGARTAFERLGSKLGLDTLQAAWGVFAVVCENMAAAARMHVVEKGRDPRRFAMVAFGGAGPAHAIRVAKALGVRTVIVPPASGAASSFGFLGAPIAHEAARSSLSLLSQVDWADVNAVLGELEASGREYLATAGVAGADVVVQREADVRLSGQVHTLRIAIPAGTLSAASADRILATFADAYRQHYARDPFGGELEILNWRATSTGPTPELRLRELARPASLPRARGERLAWFPEVGRMTKVPVFSRYALEEGAVISGPAIVEEDESTTVVPPGDELSIDKHGNLVIAVSDAQPAAAAGSGEQKSAISRIEHDPVNLEIMWSRLVTISEECWLTVIRTAFSLIIGEAQDFACEILDTKARSLAHSPRAMPVFNISLMTAVQALLTEYPAETLQPGDVLVTNDPWQCAGHLYDIAVVTPVFHKGRVVAFIGSVGHVSDIGGTKDRARAREVYEEGIQIPPMKLFAAGVPNRDLFRVLECNVRNPNQVLGDVQALVAANALGARRLGEFLVEYGLDDLEALSTVMLRRSEEAVRAAIRKVPNGVYRGLSHFDVSGEKLFVPLKLTVADDSLTVDYDGAPRQLGRGGVNCTMTVTRAETMFALKCIFTPGIRATAGCYRPFTVTAPEGSLFNCTRPASVGLRRLTMWYFVGTIFRTLSSVIADQVQAFTALPTLLDLYGTEADGSIFTDHMFVGGGQGASSRQDGKSGVIWPTSAANTAIEMVESRIPVLVLEKSLIRDSAGPGTHRGGLGQRVRIKRLRDDGFKLFVNVYPEGDELTTDGIAGGGAGGHVQCFRHDIATGEVHPYGVSTMVDLQVGEIIEVRVGGGAGFGPPKARSAAAIARDRADDYIT